jgi:hypothetical protein
LLLLLVGLLQASWLHLGTQQKLLLLLLAEAMPSGQVQQ